MSRATEEQVAWIGDFAENGVTAPDLREALRALLAERAELLKDQAVVDWFEENQRRIQFEGCGAIFVAPLDTEGEPDWDAGEVVQVGENGRGVAFATIPVDATLRRTLEFILAHDAATPPKSEAAK